MAKRIHIVTHAEGWAIKREGNNEADSLHGTQREAIDAAREIAENDEADIIVHRRDGSFRNVLSFENGHHDGRPVGAKSDVQPEDLFSVGSRISWGAVLAGTVIALTVYLTFSVLATAIGLSVADTATGESLAIGAIVAWMVICLSSMFLGGYVVSRTTAGETGTEAVLYGLVLWGTLFIGLAALAGLGIGLGADMMAAETAPAPAAITHPEETLQGMDLSEQQVQDIRAAYDTARGDAKEVGPTSVAWWTFAAMLLSMGAAVLGSVAGSGPSFYFIRRPSGNVDVSTKAPKN